jgi:hypothetical protein
VKSGWLVGVVGVVVLAYITVNTLRTEGLSPRGLERGTRLPPFAMPLARSASKDQFANVATRPDSGLEGKVPACTVRGPEILNVCELAERGPVVLAFVVTGLDKCADQLDVIDRVAPRFPDVGFAAVAVGEDLGDLRRRLREHRWRTPIGYDHDGAVANLYGVAVVCPLLTFAGADGRVAGTELGTLGAGELAARVEALRAGRPLPEGDE